MGRQAERWGSELLTEDVELVDLSQRPFLVRSTDTEARPRACSFQMVFASVSFLPESSWYASLKMTRVILALLREGVQAPHGCMDSAIGVHETVRTSWQPPLGDPPVGNSRIVWARSFCLVIRQKTRPPQARAYQAFHR